MSSRLEFALPAGMPDSFSEDEDAFYDAAPQASAAYAGNFGYAAAAAPQASARAAAPRRVTYGDIVGHSNATSEIVNAVQRDPELTEASAMLRDANLLKHINAAAKNGPVSLFLATDAALEKMPKGGLVRLRAPNAAARKNLRDTMRSHVVTSSGRAMIGDSTTTASARATMQKSTSISVQHSDDQDHLDPDLAFLHDEDGTPVASARIVELKKLDRGRAQIYKIDAPLIEGYVAPGDEQ